MPPASAPSPLVNVNISDKVHDSSNLGTSAPFAASYCKVLPVVGKVFGEGVSSSSVAVDVESADVQAERERVAGLIDPEQQCIVMHDLSKVYPAQVNMHRHLLCTKSAEPETLLSTVVEM